MERWSKGKKKPERGTGTDKDKKSRNLRREKLRCMMLIGIFLFVCSFQPLSIPMLAGADGGVSMPGTTPGTTPVTAPGTTPGTTSGTTPGTTSGTTPGTTSGTAPGTTSGTAPGSAPGSTPGSAPGTTPVTSSGSAPGSAPGTTPGTAPGITPGSSSGSVSAGVGASTEEGGGSSTEETEEEGEDEEELDEEDEEDLEDDEEDLEEEEGEEELDENGIPIKKKKKKIRKKRSLLRAPGAPGPEAVNVWNGFEYSIETGVPDLIKTGSDYYLQWNYKLKYKRSATIANAFIDQIQNIFTTTKESGLGAPEIVGIQKNGASVSLSSQDSAYGSLMHSLGVSVDPRSDSGDVVYTFTVRAKREEIRYFYEMDFHANSIFRVPAGSYIRDPFTGETRLVTAAEEFHLRATRREGINIYALPPTQFKEEKERTQDSIYRETSFRDDQIIAGDYIADDQIRWLISQSNTGTEEDDFPVNVSVDASQEIQSVDVHYYRPDDSGTYVLDHTDSASGSLTGVTVPSGWIVQVEVISKVKDAKKNHTILRGAELESLKADLVVEKVWEGTKKEDCEFHLTGGNGGTLDETLTILKTDTRVEKPNLDKFTSRTGSGKRITYEVREVENPKVELLYESYDRETLSYLFKNKVKESLVPTGVCTDYGVTSLEPIVINEYFDQNDNYGHGGNLKGKFRIPARAKSGSSFTIELPDDLIISDKPNATKKFFDIRNDMGTVIGEVYHTSDQVLKFVLNENAYAVADYEGSFEIGTPHPWNDYKRVNGTGPQHGKTYYTGIDVDRRYFYNPSNSGANMVNKSLPFACSYMDREGLLENCDKTLTQSGTVYYKDPIISTFHAMNKEVIETGPDYVLYNVLLNARGVNGWAEGSFIDYMTDSYTLYHGDSAASMAQDIKIYEVEGLRQQLSYKIGTEKMIYPTQALGTAIDATLKWNTGFFNPPAGYPQMGTWSNYIRFEFQHTTNRTILIQMKVKLQPGWSTRNGGKYYNNFWGNKGYGMSVNNAIISENGMTTGIAAGGEMQLSQYSLTLRKTDLNHQSIKNNYALFRLYDKDMQKCADFMTDADGKLLLDGLSRYIRNGTEETGIYYLKEMDAPNGYELSTKVYKIVINAQEKILFGEKGPAGNEDVNLQEVTGGSHPEIPNRKLYSVRLRKTDEAGNAKKGARFRLQNVAAGYDMTTPATKDVSEFVFYNLKPSTADYVLTEEETPDGYVPLPSAITFKVNADGNILCTSAPDPAVYKTELKEDERVFEMTVINKKMAGFRVRKVSDHGNKVLGGAIFVLTPIAPIAGSEIVKVTSYGSGSAYFENLAPGQYRLSERQAPTGYYKSHVTYLVEVDASGNLSVKEEPYLTPVNSEISSIPMLNFSIVNEKERKSALPFTGGGGRAVFGYSGLLLMLTSGLLLAKDPVRSFLGKGNGIRGRVR